MQVEIWADLVCPWCYVGRARFGRALASFPHRDQVTVVHRSFELDPDFPPGEQTGILDLLSGKYGMSREQAAAAEQRIAGLAAAGLDRGEVEQVLAGGAFTDEVRAEERQARQYGITGVPYAVAAGRLAVPGCQPAEVYTDLLGTAWAESSPAA
jgi:predicted DsbA family dithiol-disulfide isomerase